MKKIVLILLSVLVQTSVFADQSTTTTTVEHYNERGSLRTIQLGVDLEMPYRVDSPSGRSATLFGVHGELFLNSGFSVTMTTLFGLEEKEFNNNPIYFTPGMSFYLLPQSTFEPYLTAGLPILLNNGQDIGIQGGLGLMWNSEVLGFGLKYSFDVARYFDAASTSINWAHISAVFTW